MTDYFGTRSYKTHLQRCKLKLTWRIRSRSNLSKKPSQKNVPNLWAARPSK